MKTPFYERHLALGAKIVDFNGWQMPIHYPTGIIQEHLTVRKQCGLFDVSHMGRIDLVGPQAEACLEFLSANRIGNRADGTATYTTWCHPHGGTVDDLIVFRVNRTHFFIVVNASNRAKDLAHLEAYAVRFDVAIVPPSPSMTILALQGPQSKKHLQRLLPQLPDLASMRLIAIYQTNFKGIVSTTGYTGAGGYEIFSEQEDGLALWDTLLNDVSVKPIGLGARDTLRLEMGYALYGHELSDQIRPTESVSAWSVKLQQREFLGCDALAKSPVKHAYGVVLTEKAIPRQGFKVFHGTELIGEVTSGNYSPVLDKPIALVLVNRELRVNETVEIEIRNRLIQAVANKLPFI